MQEEQQALINYKNTYTVWNFLQINDSNYFDNIIWVSVFVKLPQR